LHFTLSILYYCLLLVLLLIGCFGNTYKSTTTNTVCPPCPANSLATSAAAVQCTCLAQYYRSTSESVHSACTSMSAILISSDIMSPFSSWSYKNSKCRIMIGMIGSSCIDVSFFLKLEHYFVLQYNLLIEFPGVRCTIVINKIIKQ